MVSVRMLREELQLLQEPGSYVGEVVKVMGKTKVLVKVRLCIHCTPRVFIFSVDRLPFKTRNCETISCRCIRKGSML